MKVFYGGLKGIYSLYFDGKPMDRFIGTEVSVHICGSVKQQKTNTKVGYVDLMYGSGHIMCNKTKPFKFFTI